MDRYDAEAEARRQDAIDARELEEERLRIYKDECADLARSRRVIEEAMAKSQAFSEKTAEKSHALSEREMVALEEIVRLAEGINDKLAISC